jgi:hypothetical protein
MRTDHRVPAAPFRAILNRRISELKDTDVSDPHMSTAKEAQISDRLLRRIMKGQELIEFDTADKIVTHLEGPMSWHERPSLRQVYYAANLKKVDARYPIPLAEGFQNLCSQGHDRDASGVYADGSCRLCKVVRDRASQPNKSGRTRRKRVDV